MFGTDLTSWNLQVSPVVHCLEFYIGILLYHLSSWIKLSFMKNSKYSRLLSSVLELLTLVIVISLVIIENRFWMSGDYVLLFGLLIVVCSWDCGIVSTFLSTFIFRKIGSIEFEFFILHQVIIRIINLDFILLNLHWAYRSIITFIILLICCGIWKCYFKSPTTKGMEYIFRRLKQVYL